MNQAGHGNSWKLLESSFGLFTIGTLMSLTAGTINGIATNAIVFDRISHLTGRINNMFRDLLTNPAHGFLIVGIVYIFVLASFLGGKMLPRLGMTRSLLVPIVPLVLVCLLLFASGVTQTARDDYFPVRYGVAYLLALAMGLQNSVTSQTLLGRTTHFTGDLTDMGLALSNGKWRQAGYICAKHLGFAVGGLSGYLFSRSIPEYVGIAIATACFALLVCAASYLSSPQAH